MRSIFAAAAAALPAASAAWAAWAGAAAPSATARTTPAQRLGISARTVGAGGLAFGSAGLAEGVEPAGLAQAVAGRQEAAGEDRVEAAPAQRDERLLGDVDGQAHGVGDTAEVELHLARGGVNARDPDRAAAGQRQRRR